MKQKKSSNQFDLGHIRINEKLQGAQLASFSKRLLAYSIDWIIILACTEFIWLLLPLVLIFLMMKRKLTTTLIKTRRIIKKRVVIMGQKLEEQDLINAVVKKHFTSWMVIYIYIILYLPIIATVQYIFFISLEYISPEYYELAATRAGSVFHLLARPVFDLADSLNLLSRFFGAFLYFSIFTWQWNGQTPAKRLFKISIVKLDGSKLSFWNSLERASGYTASASILFIGFFQYFWDRNSQTTHDKIAETIVVEVKNNPAANDARENIREEKPGIQDVAMEI